MAYSKNFLLNFICKVVHKLEVFPYTLMLKSYKTIDYNLISDLVHFLPHQTLIKLDQLHKQEVQPFFWYLFVYVNF